MNSLLFEVACCYNVLLRAVFFEKVAQPGQPIKFFIPNVDVDLPWVAGDVCIKFGENRSSRFDLYK